MKPIKLKPVYKDYIWGGEKLRSLYGKESEKRPLAESWELSCHKDGQSSIVDGEYDGKTLESYIKDNKGCLGTLCSSEELPILIKLIDARDNLSVQVHPDDEYAMRVEGEFGKTEAWYIVDCDDDAEIIYGFSQDTDRETFRKSIEENTLLEYVNRVKVKKGDIFFIEAGTLHAICKGILLAEVQQNSNTTYRVYDYGRLQNGKPRELHIEKALDVTSTKAIDASGKPQGETEKKDGYSETLLTSCDLFTVKRLDVEEKAVLSAGKESFVSLVALEGNGVVMHGDSCVTLYKGDSLFVPAGFGEFEILGEVTVLETRV